MHGFAKSLSELSVRDLLTCGGPANSLLDEDVVSLYDLDFIAEPRFSRFEIVFVSIVFDDNILIIFYSMGSDDTYDFSGLHSWESYNIVENEHRRFFRVPSLLVIL